MIAIIYSFLSRYVVANYTGHHQTLLPVWESDVKARALETLNTSFS